MYLVVVACLVATAYAQKHCCSPSLWEAKLGIIIASKSDNDNGTLTEGGIEMALDAVNRRIGQRQDLYVNGAHLQQRLVIDYNKGIMNIIKSDGSCIRAPSGQWVSNCIPDNATVADIYFGVGANQVRAKSYTIDFGTSQVYMSVTADTCVPLTEDVVGQLGTGYGMERIVFVNVTAGVSDNTLFDVPAVCNVVAVGPPIPELGRRSAFR